MRLDASGKQRKPQIAASEYFSSMTMVYRVMIVFSCYF